MVLEVLRIGKMRWRVQSFGAGGPRVEGRLGGRTDEFPLGICDPQITFLKMGTCSSGFCRTMLPSRVAIDSQFGLVLALVGAVPACLRSTPELR